MNKWLRYLCILTVVGWLTGCNQDLFIDDFRSEVEQVQLESDKDEVETPVLWPSDVKS